MAVKPEAQAGFSLIEVLLGSVLFLAIALGTVPMFARSMVSNATGNDATKVANFARTRVETLVQMPFNSLDLTIDSGTERVVEEYYSAAEETWLPYPIPLDGSGEAMWTLRSTVRQYPTAALTDGELELSETLPAGTDPTFIHIKEIEVRVDQLGGLLGSPLQQIVLRRLKSH